MAKSNTQQVQEAHKALDEAGIPPDVDLTARIRRLAAPSKPDLLFTSHDVGGMIQMDPSSVVKWANDGLLPSYRTPGGHRRFKLLDVLTFLRAHSMAIPAELETRANG